MKTGREDAYPLSRKFFHICDKLAFTVVLLVKAFRKKVVRMERSRFLKYAGEYKDMIYRVALNVLRSPDDAEDAVQDVLLKLYTTKTNFSSEEHVRHWLIRVTLNHSKNILRHKRRREETPIEELNLASPFETEEQYAMFSLVMSLPEKYRTALYLFYYERLSVREIAGLTGAGESSVTTRLQRARQLIKAQLTMEENHGF